MATPDSFDHTVARTSFPPPTIDMVFVKGSARAFTPFKGVAYCVLNPEIGPIEAYQSISAHPHFRALSPEEIRLQEYKSGTYGCLYSPSVGYVNAIFGSPANVRPVRSERAFLKGPKVLGHEIVTFQVGSPPGEKFSVHESVIVHRSEFVRLSLRGDWKEAKERVISLPLDDPIVFSHYQHYLYSGCVFTKGLDTGTNRTNEFELLVKMYIFGEKMVDNGFKDVVIDAITDKISSQHCFDTRLTSLVYEGTPPDSPLRRLWMEVYYFAGNVEWLQEKYVGAPISAEFVHAFSLFQMQQRVGSEKAMWADGDCTYHSHGDGACYRGPS